MDVSRKRSTVSGIRLFGGPRVDFPTLRPQTCDVINHFTFLLPAERFITFNYFSLSATVIRLRGIALNYYAHGYDLMFNAM